jgi:hypothetical protein
MPDAQPSTDPVTSPSQLAAQATGGGIDMPSLIAATQGVVGQLKASQADVANARATQQKAAQAQEDATSTGADAQVQVDSVIATATAQRQALTSAQASQWGTNPTSESYIIGALGDQVTAGHMDLAARREMIAHKASVSILDDPLQWFTNSLTLPQDQYALELSEESVNEKEHLLHELMTRNQQLDQSNSIVVHADALSEAGLRAKITLAGSQAAVAKIQRESAGADLDAIRISQASTVEQHNAIMRLNSAQAQQQQQVIEEKGLALKREELDNTVRHQGIEEAVAQDQDRRAAIQAPLTARNTELSNQFEELRIKAANRDQDAQTQIQGGLDNLARTIGGNPIPYSEYVKLPPASRQVLDKAMAMPSIADDHILGYSPAVALKVADEYPGMAANPGMQQVATALTKIRAGEVASKPAFWSSLKPEEQDSYTNIAIAQHYTKELKGGIALKDDVYSPLSLSTVSNLPAIAATPLGAKLSELAKVDPSYVSDPNLVASEALKLVKNGMSYNDAAQNVAMFYQANMRLINETRQQQKFMLDRLSDQTGYRMSTSLNTTIFGQGIPEVTDWSKAVNVESYLRRVASGTFAPGVSMNIGDAPQQGPQYPGIFNTDNPFNVRQRDIYNRSK